MSKHKFLKFEIKKEEEEKKKNVWTLNLIEILPFFHFLTSPPSSMAVAMIDSLLQGMLTLEPSGKRYFERTSALREVSEMKAPNDYTICFARIS